MDNPIIKVQLELAAQNILSQRVIHNLEIDKQVEKAITKAINDFDFETEIYKQTTEVLKSSILSYETKEYIRNLVREKTQHLIEKQIDEFTKKLL